jgi:hypothetical protein
VRVSVTMKRGRSFYNYFTFGLGLDPIFIPLTMVTAALGYWLGKKYDEVKFYSEKDALTEVYNRRFAAKVIP